MDSKKNYFDGPRHKSIHAIYIPGINYDGSSLTTCLTDLPLHGADCGFGRVGVGWEGMGFVRIAGGFCCYDDCEDC